MYVALSRVTSLCGLFIIGNFNMSAIKADHRATLEYNRLRECCLMKPVRCLKPVFPFCINISLLNIRSFKKHADDIICQTTMLNSDIICLTETQVCVGEDISYNLQKYKDFHIIRNDNTDKFRSLAVFYANNIEIEVSKYPGMSILAVNKPTFGIITMMLLYRKNKHSLTEFYSQLTDLLERSCIDIILGDLNIDFSKENELKDLLVGYIPT